MVSTFDMIGVYEKPEKFNIKKYLTDKGLASHTRQYHRREKHNINYFNVIASFDIETTADTRSENAFMYVWMLSIDNYVLIGRTWKEYINICMQIAEACEEAEVVLPVYVHNLSYEFHFLRGVIEFDHVFATRKRKIIKALAYGMEYRCSYFLTHLSLEKLCAKYKVKHAKSEMKYDKFRTAKTALTKDEYTYIVNDVIGLSECIIEQMKAWNDDLYSIPVTQTGYVRREVKNRMKYKKLEVKKHIPDYETYCDLLAAFRGGNTHANRHYAGKIIKNVHSVDIASSYPAQMIFKKFPMSAFKEYSRNKGNLSDSMIKLWLSDQNNAILMRVQFFNLECKDTFGVPYLSIHKCIVTNCIEDNGRVLSAKFCETVITDIDFKIICEHYTFTGIDFVTMRVSRYGYLYKEMTDFIKELFKNKTELKGIDDDLYMRSKEMINSVYGLCAERVLHDCYELIDNRIEEVQIEDVVEAYAKQTSKAYKLYAWGVWVTSWARYDLQKMINHAHQNGRFLYADTDSVKYTGNIAIDKYNKPLIDRAVKAGATGTTKEGKTKYCGIWEQEEDYRSFASIGAKKYAYIDMNGKLHITIAGVSKESGAHELSDHGGLQTFCDALHNKFTFELAGGTGVKFNDDTYVTIERNGEVIEITPNVYIYEDTSTLSATTEYQRLIDECTLEAEKEEGH